jgi:hypothetical protein
MRMKRMSTLVWRRTGVALLAAALAVSPLAASAQSRSEAPPALRMAPSSNAAAPLVRASFGSGDAPPPLIRTQAVMGGMPMAMVMPGETTFEMAAGACAAGILVGIVAAPMFTGPIVATNAAVGCGIGIAATLAAMAGMAGARAVAGNHAGH